MSQEASTEINDNTNTEGMFEPIVKQHKNEPPVNDSEPIDDWYYAEGLKGQGSRPEWFDKKYNHVIDQAKAYKELSQRLGIKAPEKYDLSKYEDKIDVENEHIASLLNFAREKHLGQDVVEGFFDAYSNAFDSSKINYAKEIEKLGENGRAKIDTVRNWASNNLSENAIDTINKLGHTAEFINLLDELRQYQSHVNQAGQPPGVAGGSQQSFRVETIEEIKADINKNSQLYLDSPEYRKEIKARLKRATGED